MADRISLQQLYADIQSLNSEANRKLLYIDDSLVERPETTLAYIERHRQWARFMKRFATLLGVGCLMFVTMPTVPPWMAGDRKYPYRLFDPINRNAWRGFRHLGFDGFTNDYNIQLSNGNAVAAMPSLHASFALIVPAFFLPWIKPKWQKAVVLTFPVIMLTSLVYLGEHWVIDGLVGWAITGGAFWFWKWREGRVRVKRSALARAALA